MKNISDFYVDKTSLLDRINESVLQESLKDKLVAAYNSAKEKLSMFADKIIQGIKNVYAQFKCYLIPVCPDGELLPTVGGYTMGLAYKGGFIDKSNTFVRMDKEGEKLTGLKTNLKDALKIYSEDTRSWWKRIVRESEENNEANVNEVRLENQDPEAKYNVIVDGDKLKKHIKMHLLNKKMARLMIWGAPGIGKTAILQKVLDEFEEFENYKLVCKTLSNETPDNFTLPTYVETENGRRADDIPKTWLPVWKETGDAKVDEAADAACGKGLLFIDELSRATPQVLNVMLPLINEGTFNGFKLGSGWGIIVASNRDEDELAGQTPIGNALSNRFAHLYFEPCVDSWKKWAEKENYISPLLLQWLDMPNSEEFSGGKFYYMDPNETLNDTSSSTKLMCTPRAWTNAMRELAEWAETSNLEGFKLLDIDEDIIKFVLNKYVPASAVDSFWGFLNIIKRVGNFDAAVESVWKNGGKGLNIDAKDLRKVALPLAQLIICARNTGTLPTEKEFENLTNWVVSTGNDQLAAYVYNIFQQVYADVLPESQKEDILRLGFVAKSADAERIEKFNIVFKKLLDKYHLKSITELPDYRSSIKKIVEKYKDIFNSTTVNGVPAMA